jgi:diaminohydroxyphosphoribosylaminopyrimidine deaminase/5-amino-6-(5-phosphoribosylamino)uracil reductase
VLDYDLSISPKSRCICGTSGGATIVIAHTGVPVHKIRKFVRAGARVVTLPGRNGRINLNRLMKFLHKEQILSVLVEGGRQVAGSFFQDALVDKVVAFTAPVIIGGKCPASPVINTGIPTMDKALSLKDVTITLFDDNVCLEGYVR